MRTLQAYAQAVGTQIGVGLGSALRHVIVLLNQMMKYVLKAAQAFATFMQTIFGKYKGGASGIAMEGLGDAVDYADDLGDAASNAAGGLGDAADSAKELKKDLSVLPFDELNQLNKDREQTASGGSGGSGVGGLGGEGIGDGLLDWGDLLDGEAMSLPDAISAWAQQIKAAFTNQDWNLLGQIIARGLNEGLQKVYDVLDPEKVKQKVDPWIEAFTISFNSFVKWFDFDLLGRTVGRGINDVVHILNTTIEGIDWVQLGTQIANGLNGLFDEVDWRGLGNLVGNKLMALWNTINGFVHGFSWTKLGLAVSNFFNGVFKKINFSTIGDAIATGLNGAFDSLAVFTATFNWTRMVNNLANGINTFIDKYEWKQNGMHLNEFLKKLVEALETFLDTVNWEGLGQGIADFLAEIEWGIHLRKVGKAVVKALGELLKGLFSEPEGAVAAGIIAGLTLLKFSQSSFGSFAGNLVKAITGKTVTENLTGAFKTVFSKSVKDAAESEAVSTASKTAGTGILSTIGTTVLQLGGVSLAFAGAYYGLTEWEKHIGSSIETSEGLNGVLTEMGSVIDRTTFGLENAGRINRAQNRQLIELADNAETAGLSSEEMGKQYVQALYGMGLTSNEINEILGGMANTAYGSTDSFWMLKRSVEELGTSEENQYSKLTKLDSQYKNSKDALDGYNNDLQKSGEVTKKYADDVGKSFDKIITALYDTKDATGDSTGRYAELIRQLTESQGTFFTTEEIITALRDSMNDMNFSIDDVNEVIKGLGYQFDESGNLIATSTSSMETNISSVVEKVKGKIQEANAAAEEHAAAIKSATDEVVKKWWGAKDATDEFATSTQSNMSDTTTSVSDFKEQSNDDLDKNKEKFKDWQSISVGEMVSMITKMGTVALGAKNMSETSSDYADKMADRFKIAFGNIQSGAQSMIEQFSSALSNMERAVEFSMHNIHSIMSIDLYWDGQSAAQSFANGFQSVHIPTPYMYISGYDYISFGDGGWMSIPYFSVGWYKKGGLFMGGDGQMIGVAEDGRDEAVLPLEDRRAMARIGSAIADASGDNNGMNADVADRLAERIADIIINTRSDEQQPMNYVELKVNDEVLARAVTRGQQKLDYRNNPTAQIAY